MVKHAVIALCVLLLGACSFKERDFGDRGCATDQECPRPDQSCIEDICTQRACTTDLACGSTHDFACTSGGCVVQECSGTGQAECQIGYVCESGFCQASFNVASVVAVSNTSIAVTFDSPPDATTATVAANYAIDGLTVSGTPVLSGSTVTLTTSVQASSSYSVTVTNVTRDFDKAPLIVATGAFTGRHQFNVTSATAMSAITVAVTFTEPPDAATAMNPANYAISGGLTVTTTPTIAGNTVTLTTSPQTPIAYTVTVSNVRRAGDSEALTSRLAMFTGRDDFNIAGAESKSSTSLEVTFDAAPNSAQATTIANYTVMPSLTLSGTPTLLPGNKVLLTTSAQLTTSYTVTVAGVTRATDAEPLMVDDATFLGRSPFNVTSVSPVTSTSIAVTFDAPPNPAQAATLANYSIPTLTLSGTPQVSGNVVTITTAPQVAKTYTLTVSNIARDGDSEAMTNTMATFFGRPPFNVTNATATSNTTVQLTFDSAPNSGQATALTNYTIAGLTVLGVSHSNNLVTLTTSPQVAQSYTVMVANVTRATDGEALTTSMAQFGGRASFNVMAAAPATSSSITVTFDAPPNAAQATNLANYDVPGLTLSGTPVLVGSTVTIATGQQLAQMYTVTVSNVTRAVDAEAMTVNSATFTGRAKFNVASAQSANNVSFRVTFDAPPNPTQATTLANYDVPNLTLMGTPVLSGNTVTIGTSSQVGGQTYTVTVQNVTRATDMEPLLDADATFTGLEGFNVASAASVNTTSIAVTFDAPPNPTQATTLANYAVPGLTLSGTPQLAGNTVTITTSVQVAGSYTVTVNNVTRASDSSPLQNKTATFTYVSFNVAGASAVTNRSITVTFDAPPTPAQATTLANYNVTGMGGPLTLMGTPVLTGNTVTIQTASQNAITYTVTVNNVTRASDGALLANKTATFVGRSAFNVASAAAPTSGSITVTFNAVPNATQATTLANYSVSGLTLSGTPQLSGSTVTLTTSIQDAINYTVVVANVTRASDAEPLNVAMATFAGKALTTPTVTNVEVLATVPDNATTFFNTGSATVRITGTDFANVNCSTNIGVRLDDLRGDGMAANTPATSCTVNSNTQITAVFPSGIQTNGTTGWNVRVTNSAGTNTTSAVKLVVKAGLLISEVYVANSGSGGADHEFLEIYNPTNTELDVGNLGLVVHVRSATGVDVALASTYVNGASHQRIKPRGFLLFTSTQSSTDPWFASRDATYDVNAGGLVPNGGVYISLASGAHLRVLDKVGWGTQPAPGFEGTVLGAIGNRQSAQREPAQGGGAATDTDSNSADFHPPSETNPVPTPLGTAADPQPN